MKLEKKTGKKKKGILAAIALTLVFVAFWLVICGLIFRGQILNTMPCWVIREYLKMKFPMGTTDEELIAVIKSHPGWEIDFADDTIPTITVDLGYTIPSKAFHGKSVGASFYLDENRRLRNIGVDKTNIGF